MCESETALSKEQNHSRGVDARMYGAEVMQTGDAAVSGMSSWPVLLVSLLLF